MIEKDPNGKLILFNHTYNGEVNKETLDEFVKEYSFFKTYDDYINTYLNLKNMDFDTLINIAPDFRMLYNEPEFVRLLNDYIKRRKDEKKNLD